jgi:hypothetical protein
MAPKDAQLRLNTSNRSRNIGGSKLNLYIAALNRLEANIGHTLKHLESSTVRTREHQTFGETTLANMSLASLDDSIKMRCRNLQATLNAIEREKIAAQIELGIALSA